MSLTFGRVMLCFIAALTAGTSARGATDSVHQAQPYVNGDENVLPDLPLTPEESNAATGFAKTVKTFGEQSQKDDDPNAQKKFRQFIFTRLRDYLAGHIRRHAQDMLSPLGSVGLDIQVNDKGDFTGSSGSLFTPWLDTQRIVTYSELGFTVSHGNPVGNLGVGQRFTINDGWLLGYNTFYDNSPVGKGDRMGVGAEVWGNCLRFSANYYQPLGGWHAENEVREQRLARGYDVTARAWLPFYRYISTSVTLEHYIGDRVSLSDDGNGYHNPTAVKLGLNYTPVPLVTLTARHRQGEKGLTQENLGMQINYRFGVPLKKQISAEEVAPASSLRGSRYDRPERSEAPAVEYRQPRTLTLYLATPPWDLAPGETVELKLQVGSLYGIRRLYWHGDMQALSLTPPADPNSSDGWSVIVPTAPDGNNNESWRLAVTAEDRRGQRVTSDWITLKAAAPAKNADRINSGIVPPQGD